MDAKVSIEAAKLLSLNAVALRSCQILNLTNCSVSAEEARPVGELLKILGGQLNELHFPNNPLGDEGLQRLQIGELSSLSYLNLSKTEIRHIGALFLANSFSRLTNLQTLFLSHNDLADDGAHALASSISVL